ncbi:MAG: hypothetical protein ABMB14_27555 [Myxococcota bacterium]
MSIALVIASVSSVSSAADLPRIGVVGIHQGSLDAADQQRAVGLLITALEATGRFDALTAPELAAAIQGREDVILEEGLLSSGRQALANGKNAYNQASPDDAIASLETAIADFRSVFSGALAIDDVWESWVYLGTSQLQKDPPDEAAARSAFASAVALLPTRPLNPALYPPDVIAMFEEVRTKAGTVTVTLDVTADATATVLLDGIEKGSTPLKIPGVLPGEHFVVAHGTGTEAFARLDVSPPAPGTDAVQQVPLALGAPLLGEPAGSPVGRSEQVANLYAALGKRATDLDYVLVAGIVDASLSMQLFQVSTGTFSKAIDVPYVEDADDEAVQAAALLLNAVGPSGSFVATAPAPAALDLGSNVLLSLLLDGHIPPQIAVPVPVTGETVTNDDGKKSKVGVVLGIVGGVVVAGAAGTGAYLLFGVPEEPTPVNDGVIQVRF